MKIYGILIDELPDGCDECPFINRGQLKENCFVTSEDITMSKPLPWHCPLVETNGIIEIVQHHKKII